MEDAGQGNSAPRYDNRSPRDYSEPKDANPRAFTGSTRGPAPNRQIDSSPIGQALAGLENTSRELHATISRHGDRLEPVLNQVPLSGDAGTKMTDPTSVLERIAAAEAVVRIAIGRLESLTERLLL